MSELLIRWLEAEKNISALKEQKSVIEEQLKTYGRELESATSAYAVFMKENGLVEDVVEGEFVEYKVMFSKPRGSVKCEPSAVPDEFCDIIRKPRLNEIREYLEENSVNWATIEFSEPKLTYKLVKK